MNDKFIDQVVEQIREYIKEYSKRLDQVFRDLRYGTQPIDDTTHAGWFMLKALENPNWVLALPYVEGGMNELRRFERTMSLAPAEEADYAPQI